MSTTDNFSDISECRPTSTNDYKETLMSKYKIPIMHFEFEYIEKCMDGRELEKILKVLRSGEEGYYPDLVKTTEQRLSILRPKSKLLRKIAPIIDKKDLNRDELEEISKDLESFVVNVSKNDEELLSRKANVKYNEVNIRCTIDAPDSKQIVKTNEKSIKSTDYGAWDKYDPDTELLKMELKEERERKQFLENRRSSIPKKSVSFNKFATEAEANFISDRERERGNEYFKSGNYEEALQCYTNSIQTKANVDNLNNRAVTFLKLEKYQDTLNDCNKVLSLEKDNLKALLRKAQALEKMLNFKEALECAETIIKNDPNNTKAQELASRVRENCYRQVNNTRMKIVELD
ncbi:unnamed protein product [Phaedon cochleariae]|uniref:Sperm-associated antigen 1 n=1 Tax=Phaedon cochleariae TaxID=80249 RepID=A0A9P0GJL1_PHACE|nr:unnamed protein product [Phaedon cochleariae]